jgi:hypothetical protein
LQALLTIQALGALVIDRPALSAQQDMDTPIAIPDTGFSELADAFA